jgi:predicted nucleic acid-binding Zn ribbon protein
MTRAEAGKLGAMKSRAWSAKQRQQIIDEYNKNPKFCLTCNQKIEIGNNPPNRIKKQKFCSRKCIPVFYKKKKDKIYCINCGKEITTGNNHQYCSGTCQQEFKYNEYIKRWKLGLENGNRGSGQISNFIKKYLKNKFNNKCAICGWAEINQYTGNIPLEVEHIDGDSTNNTEDNLTLLCPNHHSLTKTYKGANKGNGRHYRRKRYANGKSY